MAAPALGYALIYYARWQKYAWLGVSPSLITVRLEDVLMVIVLTVIVGWAHLINWIQILLDSKNWRVKASKILCPFLIVLIIFQGNAIHTEVVDIGICNWSVIYLLGAQTVFFVYACRQLAKPLPKSHHQGARVVCALLCFMLLFCVNAVYYACHFDRYQFVSDDNALIVGFDYQGRAIEKEIVDISDKRVCTLASGYRLKDVSGMDISLIRFGHLMVESAP